MKRIENKVPAFDEIIFENRNKEYGAYDLRKRYKSVTSFSILGSLAFCSAVVVLLFLKSEPGTAVPVTPYDTVVVTMDDYNPELIKQPEIKPPPELIKAITNVAPVVGQDTTVESPYMPSVDEIIQTTQDGDVSDTNYKFIEQPTEIIPPEPEKIFIKVEEMPEYPGGNSALLDFIAKNTVYPQEAINNNIQGRVTLKFVVNIDGSVDRIEILRGVDPLLDQEAVRVVSSLQKFKPGKQGGTPVRVWFSVPVNFQLRIE